MSAIKNLLVWRDAKAFYTTGSGWVDGGLQPATTCQYLDRRNKFGPEKMADAGDRISANADNSHQAASNVFTPIAEKEIAAAGCAKSRLENLPRWHSGLR
jgi:hypothetical protein